MRKCDFSSVKLFILGYFYFVMVEFSKVSWSNFGGAEKMANREPRVWRVVLFGRKPVYACYETVCCFLKQSQ